MATVKDKAKGTKAQPAQAKPSPAGAQQADKQDQGPSPATSPPSSPSPSRSRAAQPKPRVRPAATNSAPAKVRSEGPSRPADEPIGLGAGAPQAESTAPSTPPLASGKQGAKTSKATAKRPAKRPAESSVKSPAKPSPARKSKPAPAADLATLAPPLEPAMEPAKPSVAVFQIYFEQAQRAELDPAFVPYDNAASRDPLLEFAVFERLSRDEGVRLAPLWGAVSWRFARKTGLTGKAWLDEIASHPGFDLYFCNPEPENEGLYASQWHRGITAHPGFRELSSAVLRAAGHEPSHLDAVTPSSITSSCNYFVGSSAFWAAYIPFVRGIIDSARRSLPADVLAALDSSRADPRGLHGGASYWPFIVERLLPLFLRGPGQGLKVYKVALPAAEAKLNAHVKRLREMKDVAHRTRSLWLHSCWLHYRNLFLLQAAGKDWCKENLTRITPTKDVVFL